MSELDRNLEKLGGYLARFRDQGISNLIGGQAVPAVGGSTIDNHSPVDESLICSVARSDAEDVDRAAKAAKAAFPAWRDMAVRKNASPVLHRALPKPSNPACRGNRAVRMLGHRPGAIASCPKPPCAGAENFRYLRRPALEAARDGQNLKSPTLMNVTTRVPIGPVGVITPWNTPFMLSTWKIAPALAAGCTVVHKPAEASPLTARLLVEIAEEAGLPPGVLNTGQRLRRGSRQSPLTEHPAVKSRGLRRRKPPPAS